MTPVKLLGSFQQRWNGSGGRKTITVGLLSHQGSPLPTKLPVKEDNGRLMRPNGLIL